MALSFTRASSEYIQASQALSAGSAYPFTIAAWFKTTNLTDPLTIACISLIGSTRRHALTIGFDTPERVQFMSDLASSPVTATSGPAVTSGNWHHAAGWVRQNSLRSAYLDGGNNNTNSNSKTWTNGVDRITIGAEDNNGTLGNYFDGQMADIGIWDVELTDDEIAILAKGYSSLFIRPQSLAHYRPLIRDSIAFRGSPTSASNGTSVADHPRIIMPSYGLINTFSSGVGPTPGSVSLTLDAALQKAFLTSTDINAALLRTLTQTLDIDGALLSTFIEDATVDAAIYKTLLATISLEAALEKTLFQEVTINAALKKDESLSVTIEAALQKTRTLTATINAYLTSGGLSVVSEIDAVLQKLNTLTATLNAVLQRQGSENVLVDTVLQLARSLTTQVNAVLVFRRTVAFTLDSALIKTISRSVSVDAVLGAVAIEYARLFQPQRTDRTFNPSRHQTFKARI